MRTYRQRLLLIFGETEHGRTLNARAVRGTGNLALDIVQAIVEYRRAVTDTNKGSVEDKQLWCVLRDVELDPASCRRQRS